MGKIFIILLVIMISSCSSMKLEETRINKKLILVMDNKESFLLNTSEESPLSLEEKLKRKIDQIKSKNRNYLNHFMSNLFLKASLLSFNGESEKASVILKYILKLNKNNLFLRKKYSH